MGTIGVRRLLVQDIQDLIFKNVRNSKINKSYFLASEQKGKCIHFIMMCVFFLMCVREH